MVLFFYQNQVEGEVELVREPSCREVRFAECRGLDANAGALLKGQQLKEVNLSSDSSAGSKQGYKNCVFNNYVGGPHGEL